MCRRHAASNERTTVRHAGRRGDVIFIEGQSPRRDGVDVRGLEDGIAIAADMIGALLVGDDKKEVRSFIWHCLFLGVFRAVLKVFFAGYPSHLDPSGEGEYLLLLPDGRVLLKTGNLTIYGSLPSIQHFLFLSHSVSDPIAWP